MMNIFHESVTIRPCIAIIFDLRDMLYSLDAVWYNDGPASLRRRVIAFALTSAERLTIPIEAPAAKKYPIR